MTVSASTAHGSAIPLGSFFSVWISVKRWGMYRGLGASRGHDGGFGGV